MNKDKKYTIKNDYKELYTAVYVFSLLSYCDNRLCIDIDNTSISSGDSLDKED